MVAKPNSNVLRCFYCDKHFPLDTRGVYHTNCKHIEHNTLTTLYTLSALVGAYYIGKGTCNLFGTIIKVICH